MLQIGLGHYLALSAILFAVGMGGVLTRRNVLVIFMSVELMLNSANVAFAAFSFFQWNMDGQVMAFMVMVVAACEVAVGLTIILSIYRRRATTNIDEINLMKW